MMGFRLRRLGSVAAERSRYKQKSSLLSESAPLNKAIGEQRWGALLYVKALGRSV